jgi:hypothetical protein
MIQLLTLPKIYLNYALFMQEYVFEYTARPGK